MDTETLTASKQGDGSKAAVEISVVIPVVERSDDLAKLFHAYSEEIFKLTGDVEFIFVLDAHMKDEYGIVKELASRHPHVSFVRFPKTFGESNALSVGFQKAKGKYVFTLSSYFQVEPCEIRRLYETLINGECDIVISRRSREGDSFLNRIQSVLFHKILRLFTGTRFRDISCGFRGMKKEVAETFDIYGDLHRFIPILAEHQGLRVKELKVRQHKRDTKPRVYRLRVYLYRIIDILTLFFLLRFTYRPLRFFGSLGSLLTLIGLAINGYLIYNRLFTEHFTLRDKPSLFLAALLMVIGIQIFAIGLLGEIIIYTHSKKAKQFNIKEYIE
ncbi:MAG: hypothetical protein COX20_11380 [Desulfobacterales bacterium CG23_combo_of_CG06-09_8_20_14_all_52_9]|nr:MAG: hypothetical protein COX20_11380 [Desulfobacterales bacterium CG23_combo_of_CG06-09_8_20_14_all_52_9]